TERQAAIALAEKIALKPIRIVKLGKEAFYRQAEMSLAEAYRYTAAVMAENMMTHDAEEGIGAFIEKREPRWSDEQRLAITRAEHPLFLQTIPHHELDHE